MTSPQIADLDPTIPVILPVAATEQHGAHLPLATDRLINEHFCSLLDKQFSEVVLILPTVSIGCSEHHLDFAGSLSITHQTFLNQVSDILKSVIGHGFRNLVLLNSHGGNQGIGQVILETMGYWNPEINLVFTSWWKLAGGELLELNESGPGGIGHAGEFETSLMLVIAPELVHLERAEARQNAPMPGWAEADLIRGSRASIYRTMKEMTPNGVFGEPLTASRDKGLAITKVVIDQLTALIADLRASV